jgi:three-Cys-motif partner protein
MRKINAKKIVLPHSKAKLDLYKSYLEKYFAILGLAKGITKTNIYDIFCGIGLYEDGNIGSPLIAVECVKQNNLLFEKYGWEKKPINLNINDGAKEKAENVKALLENEVIDNCKISIYNHSADIMLDLVIKEVNNFSKNERNLVLIDPYGYSNIDKHRILNILKSGHTEIVLFLPVMQMYRFSGIALTDFEKKCYEDLRKFIFDFFPEGHKIREEKAADVFEFIKFIKEALSFNDEYYTSSHYIERSKGNYYAVFFITSNIYGLERMLQVKWNKDSSFGQGFRKIPSQKSMFEVEENEKASELNSDWLSPSISEFLNSGLKNNLELYEFILKKEFLPKHANEILRSWQKLNPFAYDVNTKELILKPRSFYLTYDEFKSKVPKIFFKLKK